MLIFWQSITLVAVKLTLYPCYHHASLLTAAPFAITDDALVQQLQLGSSEEQCIYTWYNLLATLTTKYDQNQTILVCAESSADMFKGALYTCTGLNSES